MATTPAPQPTSPLPLQAAYEIVEQALIHWGLHPVIRHSAGNTTIDVSGAKLGPFVIRIERPSTFPPAP